MPHCTHRRHNSFEDMMACTGQRGKKILFTLRARYLAHVARPHCVAAGSWPGARQGNAAELALQATQAVTRGSWLLVEDLNLAPPDVLAALVPLLEGGALHLSHRSQVIRAAPGFQFIATVTTAPGAQATD